MTAPSMTEAADPPPAHRTAAPQPVPRPGPTQPQPQPQPPQAPPAPVGTNAAHVHALHAGVVHDVRAALPSRLEGLGESLLGSASEMVVDQVKILLNVAARRAVLAGATFTAAHLGAIRQWIADETLETVVRSVRALEDAQPAGTAPEA
jgi:hypothetical protein